MISHTPKIAYLVDTTSEFTRKIAHGVGDYMRRHGPWHIFWPHMLTLDPAHPGGGPSLDEVDGIIAPARWPEMTEIVRQAGRPTVVVASYDCAEGFPTVMTDEPAIGRLAAEHFLARGFQHFAYLANKMQSRLVGRRDGFIEAVKEAGFEVAQADRSEHDAAGNWAGSQRRLITWLDSLPLPTGLMVVNDLLARDLIQACHEMGLKIPEDISVLGVDDDLPVCLLSSPQLSSVEHNAQQIGYAAAELLAGIMAGKQPPETPVLVPPRTVVVRQSSDIMAVSDPVVADAMKFIRDHAGESINVGDVLKTIPVSRSTLEKTFRACLGRSIHQQIIESHINLAKHYLSETDLSIEKIAGLCGFQYASHLAGAFRNKTGMTCSDWRKKFKRS